jgi:multicomponent Na+:H+ antiporter subunit F
MSFLEIATQLSLIIVGISWVLVLIRFVKGPSLEDRIVSLDLLMTYGIAFIASFAILTSEIEILDVAIIIALVAFLGTVAFAYYIERKN